MSMPPPPVPRQPSSQDPRFAPPSAQYVAPPPTNGLAIAAMVVGIVSVLIPIAAPVAIVLGILALNKVKQTGQPGKTQALTGVGCGVLGLIVGGLLIFGLFASLSKAREQARLVQSTSNMRSIGIGIQMYANSWNGRAPQNLGQLRQYVGGSPAIFVSPRGTDQPLSKSASDDEWSAKLVPNSGFCSYTYLPPSSKLRQIRGMSEYVILYETNPPPGKRVPAAFADGHVDRFEPDVWAKILADLSAGKNPPPSLPKE